MTAINAPRDKYNAVWVIFFIMGLGTLLPWNFFITATMYFTSRLKEGGANSTNATTTEVERSVLEAKFSSTMTLCAMVPLLIFTCLNSFIHQKIPQKLRIVGSLSVIFGVFLITATLVKVEMAPISFFSITMICIICINSFGAVLQGSLFGLAGLLPASYTTPIMSGQGLAGTFAAISMICALASGSELTDSAFGYFITACVVILLAIASYLTLPKLEFFQYYLECDGSKPANDEENKMDLLKKENPVEMRPVLSLTDEDHRPTVSVFNVFRQIWVMALSVCFIFAITISTFPTLTVEVTSVVADGGLWTTYFIPVSCFLIFNVMDWAGRSLTAVCMWPGKESVLLPVLVVARVVFVPLFMLCNVQPRYYLPVLFEHDAWYILFMILFAFSNGYLASLCMCFGPKKVPPHEAETAGAVMAFFLSLGLALGAALSFGIRAMV
ncbi:equilibrative nucleoside transporter 1a [Megalops cyprinoides]|uniref:equilibrative nucleoside transporter 1a n=1 Tax=Megalops cyprinoides TaxID=118141 RepID=UPI0018655630|nr:equilibrative nucleoside transporter 1a [Megalops cyprinoides]